MESGQQEGGVPILQKLVCLLDGHQSISDLRNSLVALSNFLKKNGQAKDYLREVGGVERLLKLLHRHCYSNARIVENIFLILGEVVTDNERNKQLLTQEPVFALMRNILENSEDSVTIQQTALLFFSSLTANNRIAQDLARKSQCLHIIVDIYGSLIPRGPIECPETWAQLLEEKPCILWKCMTSALNSSINNPLNDKNQGICSRAISPAVAVVKYTYNLQVVACTANFLGFVVAGNVETQEKLAIEGGLKELFDFLVKQQRSQMQMFEDRVHATEAILRTLHLALKDNVRNVYELATLGIVKHLVPYLEAELPSSVKLQVTFVLSQCLELNEQCRQQFINCNGNDIAVETMTRSTNKEFRAGLECLLTVARTNHGNDVQHHSLFEFNCGRMLPAYLTAPRQVSRDSLSTDSRAKSEKRSASPSTGSDGQRDEKQAKTHVLEMDTRSEATSDINRILSRISMPDSERSTIDVAHQVPTACPNDVYGMSVTSTYQRSTPRLKSCYCCTQDNLNAVVYPRCTCAHFPNQLKKCAGYSNVDIADSNAAQLRLSFQQCNNKTQNLAMRIGASHSSLGTNCNAHCGSCSCTQAPLDPIQYCTSLPNTHASVSDAASNCRACYRYANQGHMDLNSELILKKKHLHKTTSNLIKCNSDDYSAEMSCRTNNLILPNTTSRRRNGTLAFVSSSATNANNSHLPAAYSGNACDSVDQIVNFPGYVQTNSAERIDATCTYPSQQLHMHTFPKVPPARKITKLTASCRTSLTPNFDDASCVRNNNNHTALSFPSANVESMPDCLHGFPDASQQTSLQNFSIVAFPSHTQQSSKENPTFDIATADGNLEGQLQHLCAQQTRELNFPSLQRNRKISSRSPVLRTPPTQDFDGVSCLSDLTEALGIPSRNIGSIVDYSAMDPKKSPQTSAQHSSTAVEQNQPIKEENPVSGIHEVNTSISLESTKALCKQWRKSLGSILASTQRLVNSVGENLVPEVSCRRTNTMLREVEVTTLPDCRQESSCMYNKQDKNSCPTVLSRQHMQSPSTVASTIQSFHDTVVCGQSASSGSVSAINLNACIAKDQLPRRDSMKRTATKKRFANIPRHLHDVCNDVGIEHLPLSKLKSKCFHKCARSINDPHSEHKHYCDIRFQSLLSGNPPKESVQSVGGKFHLNRTTVSSSCCPIESPTKHSGCSCNTESSNLRRKVSVSKLADDVAQHFGCHQPSECMMDSSISGDSFCSSSSRCCHGHRSSLPHNSENTPLPKCIRQDDITITVDELPAISYAYTKSVNSSKQTEVNSLSCPLGHDQISAVYHEANANNAVGKINNRTEDHSGMQSIRKSSYKSRQKTNLQPEFSFEERRLSYYENHHCVIRVSPFPWPQYNSTEPGIENKVPKNDSVLPTSLQQNNLCSMSNSNNWSPSCASVQRERTLKSMIRKSMPLFLNNKMSGNELITSPKKADRDHKLDSTSTFCCKWPNPQKPLALSTPLLGPNKIQLDKHYWEAVSYAMSSSFHPDQGGTDIVEITFQPLLVAPTAGHYGSSVKPESHGCFKQEVQLTMSDKLGERLVPYECVSVIIPQDHLEDRYSDKSSHSVQNISKRCKNNADQQPNKDSSTQAKIITSKSFDNQLEESACGEETFGHVVIGKTHETCKRLMLTAVDSADCRQLKQNCLQDEANVTSISHGLPIISYSEYPNAVNQPCTFKTKERNFDNKQYEKDVIIERKLSRAQDMPNLHLTKQTASTVSSKLKFIQSVCKCAQGVSANDAEAPQSVLCTSSAELRPLLVPERQNGLVQQRPMQRFGDIPPMQSPSKIRYASVQSECENADIRYDESQGALSHAHKETTGFDERQQDDRHLPNLEFTHGNVVATAMQHELVDKPALVHYINGQSTHMCTEPTMLKAEKDVCGQHIRQTSLHTTSFAFQPVKLQSKLRVDGIQSLLVKTLEKDSDKQVSNDCSQGNTIKRPLELHLSRSCKDQNSVTCRTVCAAIDNERKILQIPMKDTSVDQTVMCQVQEVKRCGSEISSSLAQTAFENESAPLHTVKSIVDNHSLLKKPLKCNDSTLYPETQHAVERNTQSDPGGRQTTFESFGVYLEPVPSAKHEAEFSTSLQLVQDLEKNQQQCFQEKQEMGLAVDLVRLQSGSSFVDVKRNLLHGPETSNCINGLCQDGLRTLQTPKISILTNHKNSNKITCQDGNIVNKPESNEREKEFSPISLKGNLNQSPNSNKMKKYSHLSDYTCPEVTDSSSTPFTHRHLGKTHSMCRDIQDSTETNWLLTKTPQIVDVWSLQPTSSEGNYAHKSRQALEQPVDSEMFSLANRTETLSLEASRYSQAGSSFSAHADSGYRIMEKCLEPSVSSQNSGNSPEDLLAKRNNCQLLKYVQVTENVILQPELKTLEMPPYQSVGGPQITACSALSDRVDKLVLKEITMISSATTSSECLLDQELLDIANHTLQKVTSNITADSLDPCHVLNHKQQSNNTASGTEQSVDCYKIWTDSSTSSSPNIVSKRMASSEDEAFCVEFADRFGVIGSEKLKKTSPFLFQRRKSPVASPLKSHTSCVDDFNNGAPCARLSSPSSEKKINARVTDYDYEQRNSQMSPTSVFATGYENDEEDLHNLYIPDCDDDVGELNLDACTAPISEPCPKTESFAGQQAPSLVTPPCSCASNCGGKCASYTSSVTAFCNQVSSSDVTNANHLSYQDLLVDHTYGRPFAYESNTNTVEPERNVNGNMNEPVILYQRQGTVQIPQSIKKVPKYESPHAKTTALQTDEQTETSGATVLKSEIGCDMTSVERSGANMTRSNFDCNVGITAGSTSKPSFSPQDKRKVTLTPERTSSACTSSGNRCVPKLNNFPEHSCNIGLGSGCPINPSRLSHRRAIESAPARDKSIDGDNSSKCIPPVNDYIEESPNENDENNSPMQEFFQHRTLVNDENDNIVCVVTGAGINADRPSGERPIQSEVAKNDDAALLHQGTSTRESSDGIEGNCNLSIDCQELGDDVFGTVSPSSSCLKVDSSTNNASTQLVNRAESSARFDSNNSELPFSPPEYLPTCRSPQVNCITVIPSREIVIYGPDMNSEKRNGRNKSKSSNRDPDVWKRALEKLKGVLASRLKWKRDSETKKIEVPLKHQSRRKSRHTRSDSTARALASNSKHLRPYRPRKVSHSWRRVLPFTVVEDAMLRQGVAMYGYNWQLIVEKFDFVDCRTPYQLRNRWRYLVMHDKEKKYTENMETEK